MLQCLPQRLPREGRQNKARFVNLRVVVPAQLILFLQTPASQGRLYIPILVLAADHESNLPARIRRDGSIRVFDGGEDFFAGFLEVSDQLQVEPLVLR